MNESASTAVDAPRATAPNAYPALGYRDAKAAIGWLCDAFGFEERMVRPGDDGREVAHAELHVAVADVDAHHGWARAAGAEIVRELIDTDYGSREYACRDLEGNVWSSGTYQPVAGE